MKKLLYAIVALSLLTACGNKYNILGSSNISTLDGHKLYLKVLADEDLKSIDSCEIVHGKFHFSGPFDQVKLAHIYMDEAQSVPLMYVVLEDGGDIQVTLDLAQQTSAGTPLNDTLSAFLAQYNQLLAERRDLVHRHDQAIMDGSNMDLVYTMLAAEENRLAQQEDSLVTGFVTANFDNVLGPGVFFLMTMAQPYPQLSPWIEYIMSKATDDFKNDPYVKEYYEKAQENEKIMNGLTPTNVQEPATTPTTENE